MNLLPFLTTFRQFESDDTLSLTATIVLEKLYQVEQLNCSTAARLVQCSRAAMTGTFDKLEDMGLIETDRAFEDRRKRIARLTEEGTGLMALAHREDPAETIPASF